MLKKLLAAGLITTSLGVGVAHADTIPSYRVYTTPAAGLQYINTAKSASCAFGFAAQRNGVKGFITAGHCGQAGDPVYIETPTGTRQVGQFTWSIGGDDPTELADIAFIQLFDPSQRSTRLANRPIEISRGITEKEFIQAHPDLCKEGPKTGSTCGEVDTSMSLSGYKVSLENAYSAHGDSGAPMVARLRDGSVAAVAILTGSPEGDDNTAVGYPVTVENMQKYGITLDFSQ